MQPRPYQAEDDKKITDAWAAFYRNVLYVLPCGGGKTYISANRVRNHQGYSVAIAHREKLVSQMSCHFAENGIRHRIFAPQSVVNQIIQLHIKKFGKDFYDASAPCAVGSVDTMISWAKPTSKNYLNFMRWAAQVTLWITDECFPAGTMVDGRPIEDIKVGDLVTAFDEHTGKFAVKPVVRLFKNPMPPMMVTVVTTDGRTVSCTVGHPFWTQRGWVHASELNKKDEVLIYELQPMRYGSDQPERSPDIQIPQKRTDLLQTSLRLQTPGRPEGETIHSRSCGCALLPDGTVFNLRVANGKHTEVPRDGQTILRQEMLDDLSVKNIVRNNGSDEQEICIRQDEVEQPNVKAGEQGEDVADSADHRSQASDTGRQRQAIDSSRGNAGTAVRSLGVCATGRDKDGCQTTTERDELPSSLQSGPGSSPFENRNRSGREQSLCAVSPGAGSKERAVSRWTRVDSVTFQERSDYRFTGTSDQGGYVYNIEVADHHTYVANGIVVHNCHHLVRSNKWGKVITLFPNAKGLGVTATPIRADGKGLGRHADGVFDILVEGPRMRQLINGLPDENGVVRPYLCDYRIFCPPNDLDVSDVPIGADGDYVRGKLAKKTRASTIMGNVIDCYQQFTPGLRGVTFAPDMETAIDFSKRFNEAGVPSEIMTAETPTHVRFELTSRLEQGKLLMLVTIDLIAEGFDLPAIEVAIMARKTESYGLFVQQFGRPCRMSPGKSKAIIIDHVNNVLRHGLPDREGIEWTLDRRERSAKKEKDPNVIPMRICCNPVCMSPYSRVDDACPFCGWVPVPVGRSKPEEVDGCVYELDPATLAAMRGEIAKVDEHPDAVRAWMQRAGHPPVVYNSAAKSQREKQEAQAALRQEMSLYGGIQAYLGLSDREAQRKFYHQFGIDVLGAQALPRADAEILTEKIGRVIGRVPQEV
jgi:DNA repair protein RadD